MTETCSATSPDKTRCDRPKGHWGKHDGPISVSASGINEWTWE